MKKVPICMDSYQYMFNCCRIPEKPADFPRKFAPENKHLVVVRKGQFYKVVHEVDGKQLSTREFEEQFRRVLELAKGKSVPAVGALTSENRDIWTDVSSLNFIDRKSFPVSERWLRCQDNFLPRQF